MSELFDRHGRFRRLHAFTLVLATIVLLDTLRFCRQFPDLLPPRDGYLTGRITAPTPPRQAGP